MYKLVAEAELADVWLGGGVLIVGHRLTPPLYRGWPVRLSNGMSLNVEMSLRVNREPNPAAAQLQTMRATYAYQASEGLEDPSPVFSYQYDRTASSPYPRCHLHVHATPEDYTGNKPFPRLHLPTRRISLEQVVWHLIQEHGVQPRREDWHEVLWRHEEWFRDIQKHRDWPYDRPFDWPDEAP